MAANICENCSHPIKVAIFKGSGHCSEYCRKVLAGEIPCSYEDRWIDEVGVVAVCVVHEQNSKYAQQLGPNRPCIEVDPWTDKEE